MRSDRDRLDLTHMIRKPNRFELKYVVPIKRAEEFRRSLRGYLVPDDHGDSLGCYYVSSLYYDGPDLRFYWEKVNGIRVRRKLRIRHYESSQALDAETPVYVEIKQRLERVTQKRRVTLPYREALRFCSDRRMPETSLFARTPQDAAVLDEIGAMLWQYDLRPASVVSYARQALVGTESDVGLRVTFDNDLRYRASDLDLHLQHGGHLLFPPGWTVLEIKANDRVPYWLTELVAAHNLNLIRVSKYCRSIELAENLPRRLWRSVQSEDDLPPEPARVGSGVNFIEEIYHGSTVEL